jgi:hypothetical protein
MASLQDISNGNSAKVDDSRRLHVDAITFQRSEQESELGNAYNINTGVINLTSANKSAVLYVKNMEDYDLLVSNIFYLLGNSNSAGDVLIDVLRNPTTGTIVSGASAAEMAGVNRNFGSSRTLSDSTMYKGAEANTFTDGTKVVESIVQDGNRWFLSIGDIIIPKGSSIGFNITPPASNTSMDIEVALSCYLDTLKDVEGQS